MRQFTRFIAYNKTTNERYVIGKCSSLDGKELAATRKKAESFIETRWSKKQWEILSEEYD